MKQLSQKYNLSRKNIQNKLKEYSPKLYPITPREVTLVIDATFFGKREDKFGLIVAKDTVSKKPIAYNFIETETKKVYENLIEQIKDRGFSIKAVILDGKPIILAFLRIFLYRRCVTFI